MKKVLTAFLLATLVAILVMATPAFACACAPLPSAQQQGSGGSSGDIVKYVVSPNDPCTWPTDIRPANCPAPS
jgi:hypothetical protein